MGRDNGGLEVAAKAEKPGVGWSRYADRVPEQISQLERLALFKLWGEKCAWCNEPLVFSRMEVEHLVPKHMTGDELKKVLELQG